MISKITRLGFLVILGFFLNTIASAAAPDIRFDSWNGWGGYPVDNRETSPFYNLSSNVARNLAQSAWNDIGQDCTNTSLFIKIVGEGVDNVIKDIGTKYKGPSAEEFGRGYIDGLVEVWDQVVSRCVNECSMLGEAMGGWSAKMFCRVAYAIEKTPKFTNLLVNIKDTFCGGAYNMGCESKFIGIAQGMCPKYADSKKPAFTGYYRAAKNGCCSYNPY